MEIDTTIDFSELLETPLATAEIRDLGPDTRYMALLLSVGSWFKLKEELLTSPETILNVVLGTYVNLLNMADEPDNTMAVANYKVSKNMMIDRPTGLTQDGFRAWVEGLWPEGYKFVQKGIVKACDEMEIPDGSGVVDLVFKTITTASLFGQLDGILRHYKANKVKGGACVSEIAYIITRVLWDAETRYGHVKSLV